MNISYLDLKYLMSDYNERLGTIINCYNNCIRELIENNEIDLNKLEEKYNEEFYLINEKEIKFNLLDIYSVLKQKNDNEDYYHIVTLSERGDSYCKDDYTIQNRYRVPVSIFDVDSNDMKDILKNYLKKMYSITIQKKQNEEE